MEFSEFFKLNHLKKNLFLVNAVGYKSSRGTSSGHTFLIFGPLAGISGLIFSEYLINSTLEMRVLIFIIYSIFYGLTYFFLRNKALKAYEIHSFTLKENSALLNKVLNIYLVIYYALIGLVFLAFHLLKLM